MRCLMIRSQKTSNSRLGWENCVEKKPVSAACIECLHQGSSESCDPSVNDLNRTRASYTGNHPVVARSKASPQKNKACDGIYPNKCWMQTIALLYVMQSECQAATGTPTRQTLNHQALTSGTVC
ncbi:hypothetical protein BaRGS_00014881 [Batillaria attramentaria]|uniref:Uncharacterized protein n=1 Tax=Batillaria attramentaria TaxID=370345 RepID=A0ABD0L3L9_9CAEN